MDQIRLEFIVTSAQKVVAINSELGITKLFSNVRGRMDTIENELRAKDISPYEIMKDPKKAIKDNDAALRKINNGVHIPVYEIKPL